MKTKILLILFLAISFFAVEPVWAYESFERTQDIDSNAVAWGNKQGSGFQNVGQQFVSSARSTFVPYTQNSGSLLTAVRTDVALNYLGFIFGNVDGVLQGAGSQVIGKMFSVYNTAILALGGIILMYILIVSTLNTAHEGEVMGKKWSSIWIPVRSALGVGLLVPKASGYSAIQIFMMWVIVQGIGAANSVWNSATEYLQMGGVLVNRQSIGQGATATDYKNTPLAGALLKSLVCLTMLQDGVNDSIKAEKDTNKTPVNYITDLTTAISRAQKDASFTQFQKKIRIPTDDSGSIAGICGALTINTNEHQFAFELEMAGYSKQQQELLTGARFIAVNQMINELAPVAKQIWDNLKSGVINTDKSKSEGVQQLEALVGKDVIRSAASSYAMLVQPALNVRATDTLLLNEIGKMRADGWLMAGSYFYTIIKNKMSLASDTMPPGLSDFSLGIEGSKRAFQSAVGLLRENWNLVYNYIGQESVLAQYIANNNGMDDFSNRARTPTSIPFGGLFASFLPFNLGPMVNTAIKALDYPFQLLFDGVNQIFASQMNLPPISMVAAFGTFLISATEKLVTGFLALIGASIALAAVPFVNLSNIVNIVSSWLIPIFLPVFYALWGFGTVMAFYIPMVPYLLFTFASLGWFFAVIEAMIAAPLVALGLVHPEGHEAFGRAEASIMMIANVFLKPTLIILGFIFGIIVSYIGIWLLNKGFGYVYITSLFLPERAPFMGSLLFWLFALLVFVGLYATTALMIIQKSFELIHIIPQRVISWLGHQGADYGLQNISELKGGAEAPVKEAGGFVKGGQAELQKNKQEALAVANKLGGASVEKADSDNTPKKDEENTK